MTTKNSGITKSPRRINMELITKNTGFNHGNARINPAPDMAYNPNIVRIPATRKLVRISI